MSAPGRPNRNGRCRLRVESVSSRTGTADVRRVANHCVVGPAPQTSAIGPRPAASNAPRHRPELGGTGSTRRGPITSLGRMATGSFALAVAAAYPGSGSSAHSDRSTMSSLAHGIGRKASSVAHGRRLYVPPSRSAWSPATPSCRRRGCWLAVPARSTISSVWRAGVSVWRTSSSLHPVHRYVRPLVPPGARRVRGEGRCGQLEAAFTPVFRPTELT